MVNMWVNINSIFLIFTIFKRLFLLKAKNSNTLFEVYNKYKNKMLPKLVQRMCTKDMDV